MDYIKAQAEFETARNNYFEAREKEAKKIEDYLRQKGFFPERKKHAVENWIEIEASDSDSFYYLISLQPFDIKKSFNVYHHTVFDHIGVYIGDKCESAEKKCEKMVFTNIDLPVDDRSEFEVFLTHINNITKSPVKSNISVRDFKDIKTDYINCRLEQRNEIIEHLKKEGYVYRGGGIGKIKKLEQNSIEVIYTLYNWMYIDVYKDNVLHHISLNPYSDGSFKVFHYCLLDKIGIYVGDKVRSEKICIEMELKDLKLPITDNQFLVELTSILDDMRKDYQSKNP